MNAPESTSATILGLVRWLGWAQMKAGEDWIRERDLSHPQAFVLGYLVQNPGAIQRDIAQISRTSAARVSSLLQGSSAAAWSSAARRPGTSAANASTRRRTQSNSSPGSRPRWPPPTRRFSLR